jgi:hypothetical protein
MGAARDRPAVCCLNVLLNVMTAGDEFATNRL